MNDDAGVPVRRDPRVIVRPATVEDTESIAKVHTAAWQAAYLGILNDEYLAALDWHERAARWLHLLGTDDGTVVLVGLVDEAVIGFVTGGQSRDDDTQGDAREVYAIYVHPQAWGRGVGSALMDAILMLFPASSPVSVWALEANTAAIAFYTSYGFEPDGRAKPYSIAGQVVPEIRLIRSVATGQRRH